MNIKEVLEGWLYHFSKSIGSGYTHTVMNGVLNNPKAGLVVGNRSYFSSHYGIPNEKIRSYDSIPSVSGEVWVWDNQALDLLMSEAYNEINNLEVANIKADNEILRLESINIVDISKIAKLSADNKILADRIYNLQSGMDHINRITKGNYDG